MTAGPKRLLAAAVAALALVGCTTSTEDTKAGESSAPAAGAAAAGTTAAAESTQQQAQKLAEDAQKIMMDPAVPPKEKYPKALATFRNALKIDPDNALAKDGVKLIEDVYKSMGRPVPQTT